MFNVYVIVSRILEREKGGMVSTSLIEIDLPYLELNEV
jgi:hypothetical protein